MEFEKLQMVISEVLSIEPEEVRMEMSFTDDLGADSLEIYQIMMGIEEVFDVVIDELLENFTGLSRTEDIETLRERLFRHDDPVASRFVFHRQAELEGRVRIPHDWRVTMNHRNLDVVMDDGLHAVHAGLLSHRLPVSGDDCNAVYSNARRFSTVVFGNPADV